MLNSALGVLVKYIINKNKIQSNVDKDNFLHF
jgi:hypothetical protein